MNISRRGFVATGTAALATIAAPRLSAMSSKKYQPSFSPDLLVEADYFKLANRAVEAATAAGADYADVRIFRVVRQDFTFRDDSVVGAQIRDIEDIGFGVRALVNGCWGFSASPFCDADESIVLAKSAVEQAKTNGAARPRSLDWLKAPAYTGRDITPGIDPFSVPLEERVDFVHSWRNDVKNYKDGRHAVQLTTGALQFTRNEVFIATSEGTNVSKVTYISGGGLSLGATLRGVTPLSGSLRPVAVKGIGLQQGGWEVLTKAKPHSQIEKMVEESASYINIGVAVVDIGRYDLVMSASTVAGLVSDTFGKTTQLDRVIGYEANSTGTSYLGPDPMEHLGTKVANPLVNISCNRSAPGAIATAKWDDEGIETYEFDLVKDGILVDYQSGRDTAHIMNAWYDKTGGKKGSKGCAAITGPKVAPIQMPPNLTLHPGSSDESFESMVSQIERGYAVVSAGVSTSFNGKDGIGNGGIVHEIRNGKLGDYTQNFGFLFNSKEIWENISKIGGKASVERGGGMSFKGQPGQSGSYSIDAVPMLVKNVAVIDPTRKA